MHKLSAAVLICAALVAAPGDPQSDAARLQAREAAAGLAKEIRGLLAKELSSGGFSGAVRVCSELAQERTREFSRRSGLTVRRVSLKHRNPANAPDDYERRKLAGFERLLAAGALPEESAETRMEGNRRVLRYLKPIQVEAMCLTCHGAPRQIPAEVKKTLQARYPQDRATGYRAGELRGAISVTAILQ